MSLVQDPHKVARHAFWPFLWYQKTTVRRRYRTDPAGNVTKQRSPDEPKKRPISYAAHTDSHIFAKYADDLSTALERKEYSGHSFAHSVLAYRRHVPPKSNVHFAAEAFQEIQNRGESDAIAIDIGAFFDSLDHDILKVLWARVIGSDGRLPPDHFAVYRAITQRRHVDRTALRQILGRDIPRRRNPGNRRVCSAEEFRRLVREHVSAPHARGIPQGSPISAVLANLYMLEVDRTLHSELTGLGASYRRYSDDILVICNPGQVHVVEAIIERSVRTVRLEIKHSKTLRIAFRRGPSGMRAAELPQFECSHAASSKVDASHTWKPRSLSYLGFEWDGVRMSIRSQTMARFLKKMTRAVTAARLAAGKRSEVRIRRAKIYRQFSVLGWSPRAIPREKRSLARSSTRHGNFLDYGLSAFTIAGHETIRRQLGKQWMRLQREIEKAEYVLRLRRDDPERASLEASKRRKRRSSRTPPTDTPREK